MATTLRRDLLAHNAWATTKLLDLADGLDDAALDRPAEMGFGSLRATLHHLVVAERLWLDRWQLKPWAPLDISNPRWSIAELRGRFAEIHDEREAFLDELGPDGEARRIAYKNTRGEPFENTLADLLLHVSNHGIHHRAQALNMLRHEGRKAFGIDYLFFRIEHPNVEQPDETVVAFRGRGFGIANSPGSHAPLDLETLTRYYAYSDWATRLLFDLAAPLDDAALDSPHEIGPGSLRKTLTHIRDAEAWWLRNWTEGPTTFETLPPATPLAEIRGSFDDVATKRNALLQTLTDGDLDRPVEAIVPGNLRLRFRLGETMLQLGGHGTHHRAQISNLLRRQGLQPPALDHVVWLRR